MTRPTMDDRLRAAAARAANETQLPPVHVIQQRHRDRRRVQTATASLATVMVLVAAAGIAWMMQRPSTPATLRPAHPSPSALPASVDFAVGYLPPHFRYVSTDHGPTNIFDEVVRRYAPDGDPHNGVLTISVDYGRVTSVAEFRRLSGPLHDVTIDGHRGVAGWNTGTPGQGLFLVYAVTAPQVAISLDIRGANIPEAEVLRVAGSIEPKTSGPPPERSIVPTTIDETLAGARAELAHADLTIGVVTHRASASVPAGTVLSQSPPAGSVERPESRVDLVVSSGP